MIVEAGETKEPRPCRPGTCGQAAPGLRGLALLPPRAAQAEGLRVGFLPGARRLRAAPGPTDPASSLRPSASGLAANSIVNAAPVSGDASVGSPGLGTLLTATAQPKPKCGFRTGDARGVSQDGGRAEGRAEGAWPGQGAWSGTGRGQGRGVASEAPSGSGRLTLKRIPTLAWNGHILSVPFRVCSVLCSISVLIKITSIDLVLVNH